MTKLIAVLLASLVLVCSCAQSVDDGTSGKNSADANDTTQAAETEKPLETVDLDGFELRILNYDKTWFTWANTDMDAEELNGEILNDALFNRTLKTEQNFNAKVNFEYVKSTHDVIGPLVFAGDDVYDMAMLFDAAIDDAIASGWLGFWDELGTINFEDKHWDADVVKLYNFNGRQVALDGAFSLYNYSTRHCYAFNKRMLTDLNVGYNPYDLVNDGGWTLDKLYEIASAAVRDTDGDGNITVKDTFGISGTVTRHYSALLAGSGVRYVDKDAEGMLYFTVARDEYAVSVIQKLVELNVGNHIYSSGTNDIGGGDETLFRNGHTLFTAAYINEVSALRDMDDDIGILPPPKFTEDQKRYYSLVEGGALSVILKTLNPERYENVGILLNALAYYSRQDVIPAYIEVLLKSKVSRDEESASMIELIFDSSFYDLGTGVWSSIIKNNYTSKIFLPRSTNVASVTASIESQATAAIDEFMEAVNEQTAS
ncbi:MAG: hypothetical protein ACOYID_03265 [Eubacteriales bacterium]|jgi:hypothetical protein|nr:hypothetical protein [Clostridiales bacterium]